MQKAEKVKKGIVAYFDILGYQNFIENNKIEYCIDIIENIILKLPEETENERFGFYTGNDEIMNSIKKYFNEQSNITFLSDTILFFFNLEHIDDNNKPLFTHQILFYLLFFMQKTFEAGFPMRGYIDYGEYYYKNDKNINVVAGKTLVNCHREASNLEFSGLIVSNELFEKH